MHKATGLIIEVYPIQIKYNYSMRSSTKIEQSSSSTHLSSPESSFFTEVPSFLRQPLKRFNRSNSRSRSKSREDPKEEFCSRFFVKNIFPQAATPPQKVQQTQSKIMQPADKNGKRDGTPIKSRKLIRQSNKNESHFENGLEKQLQWLKLERRCQLSEAENIQLQLANKKLSERLRGLQTELSETLHEKLFFQEKVKYYQQKEKKDPKERGNNLVKLKREIAKQKEVDGLPPIQMLQQQLQLANCEIQGLRDSLSRSQKLRKQAISYAESHKSQRQTFLQDLVQQLKIDLSQKDQIIDKIKIQLNIFRIRQLKQDDRVEMIKSEELQALKRKYGNVLKKYHEATQELSSIKRMEQRMSDLFASQSLRNVDNSLSLSP